jgi:hypothetical protein
VVLCSLPPCTAAVARPGRPAAAVFLLREKCVLAVREVRLVGAKSILDPCRVSCVL